ncbi:MAG: hypothetical protein ACKOB3_04570 [Holophagaceae bacterium]
MTDRVKTTSALATSYTFRKDNNSMSMKHPNSDIKKQITSEPNFRQTSVSTKRNHPNGNIKKQTNSERFFQERISEDSLQADNSIGINHDQTSKRQHQETDKQ